MTQVKTLVPSLPSAELTCQGAGLTHAGRVRERNEDSILTDPSGILWAVADGMGGHGHGDVASDFTIEELARFDDETDPAEAIPELLAQANARIFEIASERGSVMGATVVVLVIRRGLAYVFWAGDSRAYLCRNGALRMMTQDHSVVQELLNQGMIDQETARGHEDAHVITRAVGARPELDVDRLQIPVIPGDRLMLCSDGLTACLGDTEIQNHLTAGGDAETALKAMMQAALEAGAPDNVSAIVVDIVEA